MRQLRDESVLFGLVGLLGVVIYLVGATLFEPTVIGGGTGTTVYFEAFRAIGGMLVVAALAGWVTSRARDGRR